MPSDFGDYRGFLIGNIFYAPPTIGTNYMGVNVDTGAYVGTKTLPLLTSAAKSLLDTKDHLLYPSSSGNKIVKYSKADGTYTEKVISGFLSIVDDYGLFWNSKQSSFMVSDNTPTTHVLRLVDPDTGIAEGYYGGIQSIRSGATIDPYAAYKIAHMDGGKLCCAINNAGVSVVSLDTLNTTVGFSTVAAKSHAEIQSAIGSTYYFQISNASSNGTLLVLVNKEAEDYGGYSVFTLDSTLDVVSGLTTLGGLYPASIATTAFMWE
jgi:hypothetical protein